MKQNSVSQLYFSNKDLTERLEQILAYIKTETPFVLDKPLQKSSWWNSKKIGAIHYSGSFNNTPAILKIQGTKPTTSEALMIENFTNQNQSQLIRAPKIYLYLPWQEKLEFEAIIMEETNHQKIVNLPASNLEITTFFNLYHEYKKKCLNKPWLEKPNISLAEQTLKNFATWQKISAEIHPNHPLKKSTDPELIKKGINHLAKKLDKTTWQFMHGHFSTRDLYQTNKETIILSNLYWSWRQPFYDAVFGFHWYQYDLANTENISLETLLVQRKTWKEYILNNIPQTELDHELLELAFLERNLAGLNLDGLISVSPKAKALIQLTREDIAKAINR
ncbi:MAG: hypothetical protein COU63_00985 [Candidatus Pacebacteria bacterium CG10_big_fil_rev_8_21_14_0_10_36_11]|nr:hypothetical protein [Candidatus Pacearchaeota archaeon]OIP74593.1 MAG: hypothetical protein AUK08_00585 [Candidatus Pacebacteria bacterium CG2_30_36_39]PIR65220.1 MAG: hypothetical protein COU63_00985 [Candidatus Pacebacteria bacterium CG10_big_fil_rev_8_21_14_0_10_36_11]PJC42562.1 MAG: hypothetical protein CO040_03820 [Candidatus Pacebacteria bacterium CG_4_9_14_0_2_um_filter_36_8]